MSSSAAFTGGLHGAGYVAAVTFGERGWAQHASTTRSSSPAALNGLPDQLAYSLAKRHPVPLSVRFGHLHGIVLELQRRSRHVNIIS